MPEVALRWVSHHSFLSREHGDAVLIGASSLKHLEQVQKILSVNERTKAHPFYPRTYLTSKKVL